MKSKSHKPAGYALSIYISHGGSFIDAVIQEVLGW